MKRACVIGWPIAHSRSPLIHGYWLKHYGIDGSYTKEAVRPEDVARLPALARGAGFAGCNVTVPHKEAAFALADERDASARAVGGEHAVARRRKAARGQHRHVRVHDPSRSHGAGLESA